MNNNGNELTLA